MKEKTENMSGNKHQQFTLTLSPLNYPDFCVDRPLNNKSSNQPSTAGRGAKQYASPILERNINDESARLHLSSQYSDQDKKNQYENYQHSDQKHIDQISNSLSKSNDNLMNIQLQQDSNREPEIPDTHSLSVSAMAFDRKRSTQTVPLNKFEYGKSSLASRESVARPNLKQSYCEVSTYDQAENIVRNLVSAGQENFVEVDQAMFELELQQIAIIRQVVLVQLRRMLSLLEQIKMTQSQMCGSSDNGSVEGILIPHCKEPDNPLYFHEMVQTCAEAILIEPLVTDLVGNQERPETYIREVLSRENFDKIVFTWAEELQFEQICTQKVLDHLFAEFDIDRDGVVSERDLQISISNMIRKNHQGASLAMTQKRPSQLVLDQVMGGGIMQVPELELELETERESSRATQRQFQVAHPVQFESEKKHTGRSGNDPETLLRLKNANSQDLILAVQDMQSRQKDEVVDPKKDDGETTSYYKDFTYVREKDKLQKMVQEYNQVSNSLHHSPDNNKRLQNSANRNHMISLTQTKLTSTDLAQDYSFITNAQPSKYAVHPQDNTSELEPDQPQQAVSSSVSQERQTSNTLKSQDDIEPEMPVIVSEFQSQGKPEAPKTSGEQHETSFENHSIVNKGSAKEQNEQQEDFVYDVAITSAQEGESLENHNDSFEKRVEPTVTDVVKEGAKRNNNQAVVSTFEQLNKRESDQVENFNQLVENSLSNPGVAPDSDVSSRLLHAVDSAQYLARPHHGIVTAEFGQKDPNQISNQQSSQDLLRHQILLNQCSSKMLHRPQDPRDEQSNLSNENEQNERHLDLLNKQAIQAIAASNEILAFKEQKEADSIKNQQKLRNAKSMGHSVHSGDGNYDDPKYRTKSKVSFSNEVQHEFFDAASQNKRTIGMQTSEQKQMDKSGQDRLSKHSLYQSRTNSDFFQSSPDVRDASQLSKVNMIKDLTRVAQKQVNDMGTDPMSARKVSERQNYGSDHHPSAIRLQYDRLTDFEKQVQNVSDSSSKLLPGRKIKRKQTDVDSQDLILARFVVKPNKHDMASQAAPPGKQSRSESKHQSPKIVHRSGQSPILEVDEEKAAKRRAKRRSKEQQKSTSPKTKDYAHGKSKMDSKVLLRLVQASYKGDASRTAGFDNKRKVDFSDVDELMGSEIQAPISVAAAKNKSTKRLRKPDHTCPSNYTPSPERGSSIKKRGATAQSNLSFQGSGSNHQQQHQKHYRDSYLSHSIKQMEKSGSPSRVYKTNAKNELFQSVEHLPKELKNFAKPSNNQRTKLQPLNKRLAEARMNGLNANQQVNMRENSSPSLRENQTGSGSVEVTPIQGIDWGPDPEPVYSNQLNKSFQYSQEEMASIESIPQIDQTIDGDQPYRNFPSILTGFTNAPLERLPRFPGNKAKLTTAQQLTRSRTKLLNQSPDECHVLGGHNPFDREDLANIREEHNRTSMHYRRPQGKLGANSHLSYIDEKEKHRSVHNATNLPSNPQFKTVTSNFDFDMWQNNKERSNGVVSREDSRNLNEHPWLKDSISRPSGINQQLLKPSQEQGLPRYLAPMVSRQQNSGNDKRSMSNLTKKQIEQAQIRKSLKQQGLIPGGAVTSNSFLAQTQNNKLSYHQNRYDATEVSQEAAILASSKQSRSRLVETIRASGSHHAESEFINTAGVEADKAPSGKLLKKRDSLVLTDVADTKLQSSGGNESGENKLTARRSQQHRDELLGASKTTSQKIQKEEGQTQRNDTHPQEESMHTTNETKIAQVSHSIDVGNLRRGNDDLTPVRELTHPDGSNISPREFTVGHSHQHATATLGRKTHITAQSNTQGVYNQAIRERAERRYAAYTKKNVMTMYKSIKESSNRQFSNGNKRNKTDVANETSTLYQSQPKPSEYQTQGDTHTDSKLTSMLSKDESKTYLAEPVSSQIELPNTVSESDEGENDDYKVPQTGEISIENQKFTLRGSHHKLRHSQRNGSLPTLQKAEYSQQYLVAQPHQRKQLAPKRSDFYTNPQRYNQHARGHVMNQDLQPVQAAMNTTISPVHSKYQIVGTNQQKSHSVLRPFVAGSVNVYNSNNNSQKSLQRDNSSKFMLREQQSQSDFKIKNMYVHRAHQNPNHFNSRRSPDQHLLPMEFYNRQVSGTVNTSFDRFRPNGQKSPIAPIGVHGQLQAKLTNSSAKLLANYDYQKKQVNNRVRAKADELLMRNNSNLRPSKIPQKITVNKKFD